MKRYSVIITLLATFFLVIHAVFAVPLNREDRVTYWTLPNDQVLHDNVGRLAREVFTRVCGKSVAFNQTRSVDIKMGVSRDEKTVYLQLTVKDCAPPTLSPGNGGRSSPGVTF